MRTVVGTGASSQSSTKAAVTEAVNKALERLVGSRPSFGLVFASPDIDLASALAIAREASGAEIVGASTAGPFTENGLLHTRVLGALPSGDFTTRLAFTTGLRASPARAANEPTARL